MQQTGEAIERMNDLLERLGLAMDASEYHGMVSGVLCARGSLPVEECLALIADGADMVDDDPEAQEVLTALCAETGRQLDDPALGFYLLLPDDGAPIDQRLAALGEWCQGFLLGLSSGGVTEIERLPEASAEAVRDLVEIADVAAYEREGGEEDERSYSDLVEYVRSAVLLSREEMHPTKAPPRDDVTLH